MSLDDTDKEDEFEWAKNDNDSLAEQGAGVDWPTFSRRRILKLVGMGATAPTLSTGAATAHDRVYTEEMKCSRETLKMLKPSSIE